MWTPDTAHLWRKQANLTRNELGPADLPDVTVIESLF